jgi:hypothetical protein
VYEHLIVIREGELTYNPVSGAVEPAAREMLKVAGSGDTWSCHYFREEDASCLIYAHRFLECRLLKCWNPSEILGVIGRNLIRRFDVMNRNDPLRQIIERHDRECSLIGLKARIDEATYGHDVLEPLGVLSGLVAGDDAIRSHVLNEIGLKPEYELFILGRPLREILRTAGISINAGGPVIPRRSAARDASRSS